MRLKLYVILLLLLTVSSAAFSQTGNTADSLQQLFKQAKEDTVRLNLAVELGGFYLNTNPPAAQEWFAKAYDIKATTEKATAQKAYIANSLVQVYFMLGKLPESEQWMKTAMEKAVATGKADLINNAHLNAANVFMYSQRFDKAIEQCLRICKIYDSLQTPEKSTKALVTLGNIFIQLPNYNKALQYYSKVISLKDKDIPNKEYALIAAYQGMALAYYQNKVYDTALLNVNLGYALTANYPQPDLMSGLLMTKSLALDKLNRINEAIAPARQGLDIAIANNLNQYKVQFYAALAKAFTQAKLLDSATIYAQQATVYADSSTIDSRWATLYDVQAQLFAAKGNYTEAYQYKAKAFEENERLKELEVAAQTAANEVIYETNKMESQIVLLDKINKQQSKIQYFIIGALLLSLIAAGFAWHSFWNKKKVAKVLEESNREKEVFLKEIHHRVKNNLQIISSLLYLQFKDHKDERILGELKEAQQRIKTMALVHNKLYEKEELVHVYLKEYIQDLSAGILQANIPAGKEIGISITENKPIHIGLDTSISLGLILNELITNSCKYAFAQQDKGNISIQITEENQQYKLVLKDDGSGMQENKTGTNSLGLTLVKNLAKQLNGRAEFENNDGAVVTVYFSEVAAA